MRVPKLKRVQSEWRGPCPIHAGQGDNFAVDPKTGLWFCHSQCARGGDILALEQELTETDFKTAKAEVFRIIGRTEPEPQNRTRARIVASYDYRHADGALLYQVLRYEPKGFKQRRPNGSGGWIWNITGVRLVL